MKNILKKQVCEEEKLLLYKVSEKRLLIGKSIGVVLILDYFFYQSLWALLPLSGIGILYYQMEKRYLYQKKKEQMREQFKELMLVVSTGQRAGYSAENAFMESYDDMKALYGRDSGICRVIRILRSGRENNIPFTSLWKKLGQRLNIVEICEFAGVYEIAQKNSGNIAAVMEKTAGIIIHKLETEKEIRVLLSARKLEQRIMNVTPFLIMLYVSVASPGYFRGLYHSITGVLIMSICLMIYLGAYILSVRIVSIEI